MLLTRLPLLLRGARLACVKPAASVRSEPGSNSHVENSIIGIYVTSLNRRELHTHLCSINHPERRSITVRVPPVRRTGERHPHHKDDVTSLDKRDRQSLFQRTDIAIHSRQAPPPTFLFLLYMQLSKNRPGNPVKTSPTRQPPSSNHPNPQPQFLKKP